MPDLSPPCLTFAFGWGLLSSFALLRRLFLCVQRECCINEALYSKHKALYTATNDNEDWLKPSRKQRAAEQQQRGAALAQYLCY